ncbi:hypothetical protein BJ508DRAFT_362787 [Ascobolus immersus RN42]|uniref:Uncharacterized protein n=1 Tax=Ascobolus immersus RN42 TaxID=1160509 RepID=A0A3N4I3T0_ASCIM|nr:hypothetical protein BJ508DRAFT_362787 [Ascobolus immersus RN42]
MSDSRQILDAEEVDRLVKTAKTTADELAALISSINHELSNLFKYLDNRHIQRIAVPSPSVHLVRGDIAIHVAMLVRTTRPSSANVVPEVTQFEILKVIEEALDGSQRFDAFCDEACKDVDRLWSLRFCEDKESWWSTAIAWVRLAVKGTVCSDSWPMIRCIQRWGNRNIETEMEVIQMRRLLSGMKGMLLRAEGLETSLQAVVPEAETSPATAVGQSSKVTRRRFLRVTEAL